MLWVDGGRNPHSVSSLVWLFIQGLCCATYSCSIRWSLFSYIVDCSLPLKVHVKYNVLNIWFGYKKYLSSYWRVSSVVDICAKNAASQLLLQVTAANGKTQWANKGLGNHDLLNLYLAEGERERYTLGIHTSKRSSTYTSITQTESFPLLLAFVIRTKLWRWHSRCRRLTLYSIIFKLSQYPNYFLTIFLSF